MPEGVLERDVLKPFDAFVRDQVVARMQAVSPDCGVETEQIAGVDGLAPEPDSAAEQLARRLTGDNQPAGAISFGTEAGLFQRGGFSTVVCGPGSILQAHRPDEYIEIAQIDLAVGFMRRLIEHLAMA